MKPKQAFGLCVRVFGLIFMLIGFVFFIFGLVDSIAPVYRDSMYSNRFVQNWRVFFYGFVFALSGYLLVRCVRHIIRFVYPDDDADA